MECNKTSYNISYSLYWVEIAFNFALILFNIQLMVKVDFVPLSPEEIERVEI